MKQLLVACALLLLLVVAGCGSQENEILKLGKYEHSVPGEITFGYVELFEDNQFRFMRSSIVSYVLSGEYSVIGDELILLDKEGVTHKFSIADGELIFKSGSELVEIGSVFKLGD